MSPPHGLGQSNPGWHRKPRILLVDDDANDLRHYAALLRRQGYSVSPVASFTEGVERFGREHYDMVIVSQGTAAFEGRNVLASVLERDRNIPTLVLSRSCDMRCYLEAMQMGAFDYREKPLAAAELAEILGFQLRRLAA